MLKTWKIVVWGLKDISVKGLNYTCSYIIIDDNANVKDHNARANAFSKFVCTIVLIIQSSIQYKKQFFFLLSTPGKYSFFISSTNSIEVSDISFLDICKAMGSNFKTFKNFLKTF